MTNLKKNGVRDGETVDRRDVESPSEQLSANLLARRARPKEVRVAKGLVVEAALNRGA